MKNWIAVLAVLVAPSLVNAQSSCLQIAFQDTFRIAVTVTDGPSSSGRRDVVLNFFRDPIITATGQLTPGVSESFIRAWYTQIWADGPNSYFPTCTAQAQSYSLLEKNGMPVGNRVGLYLITLTVDGGTVAGKVRFYDYDTTGALSSVTNGTFTGASISQDVSTQYGSNYANDPFWNQ